MNKLAEYMTAHALRRRQIIEAQKRPKNFMTTRYRVARGAIVRQLVNNPLGIEHIREAIGELYRRNPTSEWEEQDTELSIAALQAFADIGHGIDINLKVSAAQRAEKLTFGDVEVSVAPDLLISGSNRKGEHFQGAVKLHFSKENGLDEEAGQYAGALLHHWASNHLTGHPVSRKHVIVIDIFEGACFRAPKATARKLQHVEAACEEVALRWAAV